MVIDAYYNYMMVLFFDKLYKYGNKRCASIEDFNNFRKVLIEEILDIYKNGRGHNYLQEIDQWTGDVSFEEIDEEKALDDFLDEYDDYFYLDNGIIYLKDNVKYDDISELERKIRVTENVPGRIDVVEDSDKLMDLLGVKSLENIIKEYSKIEEKLEKLYNKLYTSHDNEEIRKQIKSLLLIRSAFYARLAQLPEYRVDALRIVTGNYCYKNDEREYDVCPVDMDLWKNEYEDPDDFLGDIDSRIYDITQYAIFGKEKNNLYLNKIDEDINQFFMSDGDSLDESSKEEIDPLKDYSEEMEVTSLALEHFEEINQNNPDSVVTFHDPTDEFWILYVNYLNNLNNFMSIYGEIEELLSAKRRLIYALDKPETMIFDDENFKLELNNTKDMIDDEYSCDFFGDEIYFMAQELFMVPCNEYTIRKLLLVGTYYYLTKDEDLKEIIEDFKDNPRYELFYEIMINNCENMNHDYLSDDVKKLILRPNE